jgi:hypothetical protein
MSTIPFSRIGLVSLLVAYGILVRATDIVVIIIIYAKTAVAVLIHVHKFTQIVTLVVDSIHYAVGHLCCTFRISNYELIS